MIKLSHPHFFSFNPLAIILHFRKKKKIGGGFILDLEEYEKIIENQGGRMNNNVWR